ncbi:Hypothetical protein I595_658 [Croceitalea dokdonensis DOKDO 023]|uniref:Uncharacterized protein n=1 Tax=Croceitalea dokdonensis DOKDO 023 TaxID=1300341 RepID=A0A0P7ANY3_9FLAO|nr:Hypothetical protein I595_658 [Croceitalea dokdonensis DOKDO 023]
MNGVNKMRSFAFEFWFAWVMHAIKRESGENPELFPQL